MKKQTKETIANDDKASKPVIITEGTLVPLSLVFGILGFAAWITYVAHTTNANAQTITEMKSGFSKRDDVVVKELKSINTRLSRMEGKLDGLRTKR